MVYTTLLNDNTDFVSFDFLKREDLEQIAIEPYESNPNVTVLELSNISTGGANLLEIIFDNVEGISGDYYTGYYLGEYWEFQDEVTHRYQLIKVMNERERLKTLPPEYTRLVDCIDSFN